jgi:hypothetical protein
MNKSSLISVLKYTATAVILIGAGLIIFPGLISYAFGIARLILWLVVIILVANGLRYLWSAIQRRLAARSVETKDKSLMVIALLYATCTAAMAQGADTSLIIPAGTIFEGRIDTKIGSTISHAGQRFHIVVANPVLANGTTVLIPAGARVLGEVVEAIPASHVYHEKGMVKPKGKLRVQLTALEMPSGAIFPMVASLAGEYFGSAHRHTDNPNLGRGVGYVGSSAGFNQVTPQSQYASNGRTLKPQLVGRDQMLHDPLYGVSQPQGNMGYNKPVYRELEQHGNNIEIENNSPLSIRLDAALRIPFEEITQSVHGGKGLPAALGIDREDPKAKHKHNKPAAAPTQYKQEQPGSSFVPGAVPSTQVPESAPTRTSPPAATPNVPPDGDAGF